MARVVLLYAIGAHFTCSRRTTTALKQKKNTKDELNDDDGSDGNRPTPRRAKRSQKTYASQGFGDSKCARASCSEGALYLLAFDRSGAVTVSEEESVHIDWIYKITVANNRRRRRTRKHRRRVRSFQDQRTAGVYRWVCWQAESNLVLSANLRHSADNDPQCLIGSFFIVLKDTLNALGRNPTKQHSSVEETRSNARGMLSDDETALKSVSMLAANVTKKTTFSIWSATLDCGAFSHRLVRLTMETCLGQSWALLSNLMQ